ncbi:MAG: LacI family DNA-binding transcriptional regulator [Silicimonas sp.]|nr:LacI family DNA-binding transcriptional regulator [Silicimonas sp.]
MSGARVTMRDVARAVGMSPMTVSRALRSDSSVSLETRTRIRAAADRLGYVYDGTAAAFRTRKSGFVALTLPSLNNANFAETYRGLSEAMAGSGMQLLLGATNYQVEKEEELVRQLLARNPEALVLTGGHHTAAMRDLVAARNLPLVEMWDLPEAPLGHAVGVSTEAAMALVVAHLVETGRRRFAFLGASEGTDRRGAARRAAVEAAARSHGLPQVAFIDAGPAPVSMRQGAARVAEIGREIADHDALICVSDPVAFGALSACARLGLDVPGDLAITGFGQFEVAEVAVPQITTVAVEAHRIGEEVAGLLDALLAGEAAPRRIEIAPRLVPGATSAQA